MELFAGWSLKHWLGLVLLLVVFGFASRYEYLKRQVIKDQIAITNQKVTIESQNQTIETAKVAAKVEEQTQVATQQAVKQTVQKHEAIAHKVAEQTRKIEQQYDDKPPTPENVIAEAQELSSARIDGIWEAYCTAQPNAPQCSATEGANHG